MSRESILHSEITEGAKQPLIFLHGLLGSSRNWRSVIKEIGKDFQTHAIDLRNHGNSFHDDNCGVKDMCDDLVRYFDYHNLNHARVCGHSLGGKVAMYFACHNPEKVRELIVADIAPRDYPPNHHIPTLDALLELNLSILTSRKDADEKLSELIPNWAFRQFLLTNLIQKEKSFTWKANIQALRDSIEILSSNPLREDDSFDGRTLFIRGGKSGYLRSEHMSDIIRYFPKAVFEVLPHAGHDVHVEDKEGFLAALNRFLFNS